MKRIEQYISDLKKLPLQEASKVHSFLNSFFRYIDEAFDNLTDDQMFSLIHDFRVILFKHMNDGEKESLVKLVCMYLNRNGEMTPQIIEYAGLIYKYIPEACRKTLFDSVFGRYKDVCQTTRGIVAITTFIKYTNKIYDTEQRELTLSVINELSRRCDEQLSDTLEYTEKVISAVFKPTGSDVLLLIPEFLSGSSFLQPPLCLIRMKMQLKKCNIEADIFDNRIYNYSIDQVINIIGRNYRYIFVTSTPIDQMQNYFVDHRFIIFAETCKRIKAAEICEKLIVVGSHGTVDCKMLLNDISPDMIVQGEYDEYAYAAVPACENNTLHLLPSCFLYKYDGTWIRGTGVHTRSDWNDCALDFSNIDLNLYFGYRYIENTHVKQNRWAVLQASRGCPYECTFCFNIYGRHVRFKQIEHLISEWKQLYSMGCKEVFFIDQTFTLSREYVKDFCTRIIQENILIPWQCETRVDLLDEETLSLMKKASCKAIWLGIESFDPDIIKICKKNYNEEQLKDAFLVLHKLSMEYHAFIMVGMEGESKESIERTVETIEREKIKLSKSIIQCTPRPGTEYYSHLSSEITDSVSHFWQIDALRGYSNNELSDAFINSLVKRLLQISNNK